MTGDPAALAGLLVRAQSGDADALERLCSELDGYMRGFFARKFDDPGTVDDLVQETHLRFLKSIAAVREPARLRGFVAKVAVHVMQDHLRARYRRREEALSEGSALVAEDDAPDSAVEQADLERAMARLSEKSRHVLALKSEGFKYEEIAEQLELSVSAVKMQVKRSVEQLRGELAM